MEANNTGEAVSQVSLQVSNFSNVSDSQLANFMMGLCPWSHSSISCSSFTKTELNSVYYMTSPSVYWGFLIHLEYLSSNPNSFVG